jgi:hypothetical protein
MPGVLYARVGGTWTPVASTVAAQWSDGYPTYDNRYTFQAETDSLATGRMAYAQITATATLGTTAADVAGLSVTVNAMLSYRRYIVTAKLSGQSNVAGDTIRYVLLADGAQIDLAQQVCTPANSFCGPVYDTGTLSGSHTFKVQAWRVAGTGTTVQAIAQPQTPLYIEVRDDGNA